MLKYAKIINEEKQCEVGIGTNISYYKSLGMTETDVEQAWNGSWYIKGYAPEKPLDVQNKERVTELKAFLSSTDYVACKLTEAIDETELQDLKEKYQDILKKRREARAEINKLEVK